MGSIIADVVTSQRDVIPAEPGHTPPKAAMPIHARKAYIEGHLEMCRDGAQRNLIEMGRWLCRAKDEHIVEHGEWTAWVTRYAGVNERTAQRLMRVAREIPEGSQLEALGPAKLEELIKLPAPEREEAAERMDAAGKSSRQVRDEVAAMRAERDEALRLVKAQKDAAEQEKQEAEGLIAEQKERIAKLQDKLQRREGDRDSLHKQVLGLIDENNKLRSQEPTIIREVPEDYEQLKQKAKAAEEEADRLADELDRLKTASAQREMNGGGDVTARILSAMGGMMVQVGRIPAQLTEGSVRISKADGRLVVDKILAVSSWCKAMLDVLGVEEGAAS